jgi:hypothetical protein
VEKEVGSTEDSTGVWVNILVGGADVSPWMMTGVTTGSGETLLEPQAKVKAVTHTAKTPPQILCPPSFQNLEYIMAPSLLAQYVRLQLP